MSTTANARLHQRTFHVAPMRDYTNAHFRTICRIMSKHAVLWGEMEKTGAILEADPLKQRRLLQRGSTEGQEVLQLGGNDPKEMFRAARICLPYGYDELNLNCGCPTTKTGGADYGASLMRDAELTSNLIESIAGGVRGSVAISVKCRIGIQETYTPDSEDYAVLHDYVSTLTRTGVLSHVVVHARQAVLGGLSPKQNREVPPLRHDFVHALAADFPDLNVTLNGGICRMQDANMHCAESIKGIMAGRWFLRSPLDLMRVDEEFYGEASTTSLESVCDAYVDYSLASLERDNGTLAELVMPLALICYELEEKAKVAVEEGNVEVEARAIRDAELMLETCTPLLMRHHGLKLSLVSPVAKVTFDIGPDHQATIVLMISTCKLVCDE
eukprot:gene21838-26281_t